MERFIYIQFYNILTMLVKILDLVRGEKLVHAYRVFSRAMRFSRTEQRATEKLLQDKRIYESIPIERYW